MMKQQNNQKRKLAVTKVYKKCVINLIVFLLLHATRLLSKTEILTEKFNQSIPKKYLLKIESV